VSACTDTAREQGHSRYAGIDATENGGQSNEHEGCDEQTGIM